MVIHFGENMDSSFHYANTAFKSFGSWFVLILLSLLTFSGIVIMFTAMSMAFIGLFGAFMPQDTMPMPVSVDAADVMTVFGLAGTILGFIFTLVFSFFLMGITIRVYRGGQLSLSNPGKMFAEGFLAFVIMLIYMLPYLISITVTAFGPVDNAVYFWVVSIAIPVLLMIIGILMSLTALVRYAKEQKFSAAFQLKKIGSIISAIGWLRYLGYLFLFGLIVGIVEMLILIIPFVGIFLLPVIMAFVLLFQGRFVANLYETALN